MKCEYKNTALRNIYFISKYRKFVEELFIK